MKSFVKSTLGPQLTDGVVAKSGSISWPFVHEALTVSSLIVPDVGGSTIAHPLSESPAPVQP